MDRAWALASEAAWGPEWAAAWALGSVTASAAALARASAAVREPVKVAAWGPMKAARSVRESARVKAEARELGSASTREQAKAPKLDPANEPEWAATSAMRGGFDMTQTTGNTTTGNLSTELEKNIRLRKEQNKKRFQLHGHLRSWNLGVPTLSNKTSKSKRMAFRATSPKDHMKQLEPSGGVGARRGLLQSSLEGRKIAVSHGTGSWYFPEPPSLFTPEPRNSGPVNSLPQGWPLEMLGERIVELQKRGELFGRTELDSLAFENFMKEEDVAGARRLVHQKMVADYLRAGKVQLCMHSHNNSLFLHPSFKHCVFRQWTMALESCLTRSTPWLSLKTL